MDCSVCGKKIGFMEDSYPFTNKPEAAKEEVCGTCRDTAARLQNLKCTEKDIRYYENYLASNQATPAAKEHFGKLVAKSAATFESIADMMLTPGFEFAGYTIEKYLGFMYHQTALGMGWFKSLDASWSALTGDEAVGFQKKLDTADCAAINGLIKKAANAGGNAIIGVTLTHSMFAPNLVGIVATGTAVKIERYNESKSTE